MSVLKRRLYKKTPKKVIPMKARQSVQRTVILSL